MTNAKTVSVQVKENMQSNWFRDIFPYKRSVLYADALARCIYHLCVCVWFLVYVGGIYRCDTLFLLKYWNVTSLQIISGSLTYIRVVFKIMKDYVYTSNLFLKLKDTWFFQPSQFKLDFLEIVVFVLYIEYFKDKFKCSLGW